MNLIETCKTIDEEAHSGQMRRSGGPYFDHCERVASHMSTPYETAAALLHDTLEDTDLTEEDLRALLIPEEVIHAVICLTRIEGESELVYTMRILSDPIATKVKFYDILDNYGDCKPHKKEKYSLMLSQLS